MAERPILFNGAMVRAILDGRKTQTRRVANPNPGAGPMAAMAERAADDAWVRGYVQAVAEFACCETTPRRVLASATITRAVAVAAGSSAIDLDRIDEAGAWPTPTQEQPNG